MMAENEPSALPSTPSHALMGTHGSGGSTPTLANASAVARALGVHRTTVLRLAKAGVVPSFCAGRIVRFDLGQVMAALAKEASDDNTEGSAQLWCRT